MYKNIPKKARVKVCKGSKCLKFGLNLSFHSFAVYANSDGSDEIVLMHGLISTVSSEP